MSPFLDAAELLVLLLAAATLGAILVVLPQWRRLMSTAQALPIHRYISGRPGFEAELRCSFCAGRQECAGRGAPLEDCPNAALLKQRAARGG